MSTWLLLGLAAQAAPAPEGSVSISTVVYVALPLATLAAGAIGALWRRGNVTEDKHDKEAQERLDKLDRELKATRERLSVSEREKFEMRIDFLQKQVDTLSSSAKNARDFIGITKDMNKGSDE